MLSPPPPPPPPPPPTSSVFRFPPTLLMKGLALQAILKENYKLSNYLFFFFFFLPNLIFKTVFKFVIRVLLLTISLDQVYPCENFFL